jgi:Sulfotransferase family
VTGRDVARRTAAVLPPGIRRLLLRLRGSQANQEAFGRQLDRLRRDRARLRGERDALRLAVRDDRQRTEGLVAELHRLREQAFGRPERERPGLQYVFIMTYGRSGSTLLQGILSSTPGVLIRGENGGAVYELFRFHRKAIRHRDRLRSNRALSRQNAWFGIDGYPEDLALRELRALVVDTLLRPEADTRVLGFKEIRWDAEDLPDYVAFLREVFPGARFVRNTRNLEDVAKSKWWVRRPDAQATLAALEEAMREVGEVLGEACYHVHYDDYRDNPEALRGLFDWLGIEFDAERIALVMSQRHSY